MAIGVNARTAFSLFFPPILDEFGWERGLTAGAFSVGFIVSALFGPLLGRLMDRHGPRLVVSLGVSLMGAGLALATQIREVWHLYATLGFLVAGGSLGATHTGQSLYLPNWFVRRRGLAIGIAFSGVGIGSIVLLPWLQRLILGAGWRHACLAMAIVVVSVLLPLNLLFPRRRPEDIGLHPDGDAAAAGGAARADNVVDVAWVAVDWTLARALRTARFWWIALGFATSLFAWYGVQIHQTKYLIEIGFAPTVAAYALGLVGLMGVAGQIALGYLSDRVGREWMWAVGNLGFVLSLALLLAMRQHPTPLYLYLMVGAQGLLGYGLAAVFSAIPAEIFQGRNYGSIFGALTLASVGGSGVGPWVVGALYDRTGSYVVAFWLAMACSLVSALAIWLAAPRKVRAVAGRIHAVRVTRGGLDDGRRAR
jgi:MFS family permease